ncbi:hypothetical protein AWJ20_3314 [Sugiyamaella lignohabitans]|uniref:Vacuolar protein sorting-associated protein 51 homolog n=1 Tax=Sugiyamaella lignohabitans TaxID=796027 RepID=A0A167FTA3_9ASCO|nr:uncharacterized protein AWJ20_3314 [Sugiyamaella lignohabitans]ANB15676.1 hypothetical protein AWJ20_3314 [Sugiyamaella lignohabitans]
MSTSSNQNNNGSAKPTDGMSGPDPIVPLPGSDPATRRRKALRDFYKLQAAKIESSPAPTLSPTVEDDSMTDFIRDSDTQLELDVPGTTVDEYIRNLMKDSDLKTVVKTENKLVSEIRALDSEQKALVYNNYNKLIAAANTLESMHKNNDLSQVHELKSSLAKVSETVKGTVSQSSSAPPADSAQILTSDQIHAARWLLASNKYLDTLLAANRKEEAKQLAGQTVKLIERWPKGNQLIQDQLSVIRTKCLDIIIV